MTNDINSKPAISVITPVFNGMPFIENCVQSVLDQCHQDWEILIGDNGSTDGTHEWLKTLEDPRIRIFRQEKNLGIFGNLNFLFKHARAPLSQILCADDYFLKGGLRKVVEEWARQPSEVGFIRFNWASEDAGKCHLRRYSQRVLPDIIEPVDSDLYFFLFGCIPGNLSNVSVRTELIEQVSGFREDLPYAGDFEFWSRLARSYAFRVSKETVTFIRSHPRQASVHLNRQGQVVEQIKQINLDLFRRLDNARLHFLLRLHATLCDSLQRDSGIKTFVFGRGAAYLRNVEAAAKGNPLIFAPVWRWLLYLFSGGGRIGRTIPASLLLRAASRQSYS